jgi:ferredoxin
MPEKTEHRVPRVDRDLCMGSGQCVYYAPNTFDQDDDSIAIVTNPAGDPADVIDAAVSACPTGALSWFDPEEN